MTEKPPQDQAIELIKTPPLPSATSELPPPKCILSDPKPNHRLNAVSSDSALSSDSASERSLKKTRDLPNLSDCHSCGCHINHTNPQDRLQTLESYWRIVLLCRKCIKRVGSAQLCSYCFSVGDQECYKCRTCHRKVHKDCVVRYKPLPPWCYSSSELEFSVCVDCWVPKSLESSVRVYKRRDRKRQCVAGGSKDQAVRKRQCVAGGSKDQAGNRNSKSLTNVSKDAQNKTVVATKAKEDALRKAVLAKKAIKLADGALELVQEQNGISETVPRHVDDAELAIQLHRAMNSSPRISRSSCLLNSASLTVPKTLGFNGNSFDSLSGLSQVPNQNGSQVMEVCLNKFNPNNNALVSELSVYVRRPANERRPCFMKSISKNYSVYVRRGCRDRHSRLDYLKRIRLVYTRKPKGNKESCEKGTLIDGKCENVDGNSMITESQTSGELDGLNNVGNGNESSCDRNKGSLHDPKDNQKPNRYILQYGRRSSGLKAWKMENPCDGCNDGSKDKAEMMPLNCSQEGKALSGAPLQVSSAAVEASACLARHQMMPPPPPVLKSYHRQKTRN